MASGDLNGGMTLAKVRRGRAYRSRRASFFKDTVTALKKCLLTKTAVMTIISPIDFLFYSLE